MNGKSSGSRRDQAKDQKEFSLLDRHKANNRHQYSERFE
jgi:hypothetical protein